MLKTLTASFKSLLLIQLAGMLLLSEKSLAEETTQSSGHHLFILSGQSNMRDPLPKSFQAAVQKVFGADKVTVVTLAHPSQPIRRWYKKWHLPEGQVEALPKDGKAPTPNGNLYDALIASVKKATQGKSLTTVSYIWMQGEADAESGWGTVYEESFYGILDQIKADLGVQRVNYVLGRINDYWTTPRGLVDGDLMRYLQQKIGEAHDYGDWVDTDDLNTGVNPWGGYSFADGHFPTPAYAVMGERFARKACLLIDPKLRFEPDVFTAVHFDSPEDVAGHAAIGATVSGTQPSSGTLAALTNGKFASVDASDKEWQTFTSADGGVTELILDLKEPRAIDRFGINLLYHPEAGVPFPKSVGYETSEDGVNWNAGGRGNNITFSYGARNKKVDPDDLKPRSLLAIIPGPTDRGKPVATRYIRVRIHAPIARVDEMVVNPAAR